MNETWNNGEKLLAINVNDCPHLAYYKDGKANIKHYPELKNHLYCIEGLQKKDVFKTLKQINVN